MPKATVAADKKTPSAKKSSTNRASTAQKLDPEAVVTALPTAEVPVPRPHPEPNPLLIVLERLKALEETITSGFAAMSAEIRALKAAPSPEMPNAEATPDAALPLLTEAFRRHLMEQVTPVVAGMKRLEERIGFVANRLKQGSGSGGSGGGGGGQERQKPWRSEQGRHARQRERGGQQNGQPRPPQGQPAPSWTPPSAASVQGHFAPRPLPGLGFVEEED